MNRDFDFRDGPRDECGVFGVYAPERDVARLAYFALYALQHRGQESAGIAAAQASQIMTVRDLGLVSQVFDEEKLRALQGQMAIGHVRYSTTGSSAWENAQPVWRSDRRQVALAHNGNLINAVELHAELQRAGRAVPRHLGLGDHRGAALHPRGGSDRGRGGGRDAAARGRVLDRGDDEGLGRGVPRPGRAAAAVARDDRRGLLRGLRELRVRHHRRRAAARGAAGRDGLAGRARDRDAPGGRLAPARLLRVRAHLLRAAGLDPRGQPHAGVAPQDGRDPVARGAGRGGRGDRGAGLGQPGRRRLLEGVRASRATTA